MKKAKHSGKEITIVGVVEEYEEEGGIGLKPRMMRTMWSNIINKVKCFLERSIRMLK